MREAEQRTQDAADVEIATLGGGCFWCLEAVFEGIRGVSDVISGYSGGAVADPSYEQVCTGRTGHAEVVQITFNPQIISYGEILEVFFDVHDPTTLDRQGADVGPQYRSVIFYHDGRQKAIAEKMITRLNEEGVWDRPIVTEVKPLETFYTAEAYHQRYFERNPEQAYCRAVIAPKVAKSRKLHDSKVRQ